ncbi:unnamed protein product, partial [Ectocarpus sp. 12 AP-2014]
TNTTQRRRPARRIAGIRVTGGSGKAGIFFYFGSWIRGEGLTLESSVVLCPGNADEAVMLGRGGGGRVASEDGHADSPVGIELRGIEDRQGSSSRNGGFSLVASSDDDVEQLVGAGGDVVNGGKRAGGDDPRLHLSSDR